MVSGWTIRKPRLSCRTRAADATRCWKSPDRAAEQRPEAGRSTRQVPRPHGRGAWSARSTGFLNAEPHAARRSHAGLDFRERRSHHSGTVGQFPTVSPAPFVLSSSRVPWTDVRRHGPPHNRRPSLFESAFEEPAKGSLRVRKRRAYRAVRRVISSCPGGRRCRMSGPRRSQTPRRRRPPCLWARQDPIFGGQGAGSQSSSPHSLPVERQPPPADRRDGPTSIWMLIWPPTVLPGVTPTVRIGLSAANGFVCQWPLPGNNPLTTAVVPLRFAPQILNEYAVCRTPSPPNAGCAVASASTSTITP